MGCWDCQRTLRFYRFEGVLIRLLRDLRAVRSDGHEGLLVNVVSVHFISFTSTCDSMLEDDVDFQVLDFYVIDLVDIPNAWSNL
jgi:hypothetical protein